MTSPLPLVGIRVLDLTRARAGPTAVRHLADWGADVVKVEAPDAPGGEGLGGSRTGPDYLNLHRNKRAIVLNLKSAEGRDIFMKMAARADVVVENFRAGVKHRLGIGYDSLAAVNPRIVLGSISGFGQDGPYGDRPGVDQIAQGMGGLMSVTGLPGQGPVRVGVPIADLSAGNYLAMGILLALIARERTGEGQWVHTSLLEAQIAMMDFQAARWLIDGEAPAQAGNDHPTGIPMGTFRTEDGAINIAAAGGVLWRRFLDAVERPDLADDPRFATADDRSANRAALNALLNEVTETRPSAHWIEALNRAGVPCGPIYAVDETFADPQVRHLGIARPMTHPSRGATRVVGQAVTLSKAPQPPEMRPTPGKGDHTEEVLAEFGYDRPAVAALRSRGVV